MSYLTNPYMVTASAGGVSWDEPFTSDNWTSSSGSNYVDTTNNKLIRGNNATITTEIPVSYPEMSSVDGKWVMTYGYERVTNSWASQTWFGISTQSGQTYSTPDSSNQWLAIMSNDWETAGGMRMRFTTNTEEASSSGNTGLSALNTVVYCKTVFDAAASDKLKTYFYSDADMSTPLTIGSYNYRTVTSMPSDWDDTARTYYMWCAGYSGYASTNNIYPIKFYNGVNEI